MNQKDRPSPSFLAFLEHFPLVELPVTLGEDTHLTFSKENDPLPEYLALEFVESELDDLTEIVPCFSFETEDDFHAVVWWKAGLLEYAYFLATFSKNGQPVARKTIAATRVQGEKITRSVASIDAEGVVFVAEGTSENEVYDPLKSKTHNFEILPNGEIIQYNAALN
jgi:hypothetical protein